MSEIDLTKQATPGNPAAGKLRTYFDTDGFLRALTEAGVATFVDGMQLLGALIMGAQAASSAVLTIPARDYLQVFTVFAGGTNAGGIPAFRFNSDSGNNYWSRFISIAAGGTTLVNTETVSTNMMRVRGPTSVQHSICSLEIQNILARSKVCQIRDRLATGAAGTAGGVGIGGGEWVNTAAQITSLNLEITVGQLLAGTAFAVYGKNITT